MVPAIITTHILIICFSMSLSNIRSTTAHAFFNELKHVHISHQFKLYISHFQHSISTQAG